jgi:hypothetical protein
LIRRDAANSHWTKESAGEFNLANRVSPVIANSDKTPIEKLLNLNYYVSVKKISRTHLLYHDAKVRRL